MKLNLSSIASIFAQGRRKPSPQRTSSVELDIAEARASITAPISEDDAAFGRVADRAFNTYLTIGNPDALLQHVFAKDSVSSAHPGLVRIASRAFFDMLDEMGSRDPIDSSIKKMCSFVLNMPDGFRWRSDDDANHPKADEIMEAVEGLQNIRSRFSWGTMRKLSARTRLIHGVAIHRIDWELGDAKRWTPIRYVHQHPGLFVFDGAGEMYLFQEGMPASGSTAPATPVPPFRFMINGPPGKYGNPFGESFIYPLIYDHGARMAALKSWLLFADKYGTPLLDVTWEGAEDAAEKHKANAEAMLGQMNAAKGIVHSASYKIESHQRTAGMKETPHQGLVKYLDTRMTANLLGATLQVMEAEHGSRAQANTHADVQNQELRPPSLDLSESINRWLVIPFVQLNFGADVPVPEYWIGKDEADVEQNRKNLELATRLGVPIALVETYKLLNMPMPKEGDELLSDLAATLKPEEPEGTADPDDDDEPDDPDDPKTTKASEIEFPALTFAEGSEERFSFSESTTRKIDAIAAAITAANEKELFAAWNDALERWRELVGAEAFDQPIPPDAFRLLSFKAPSLQVDFVNGFTASKGVALAQAFELSHRFLPGAATGNVAMPEPFSAAAEWMFSREIMTRTELRAMARAVVSLAPNLDASAFEELIRSEVLVLARSANRRTTAMVRDVLADNIARGETIGDFFRSMDRLSGKGTLPGSLNGYLENVYRTEVANAYGSQRDETMDSPEIEPFMWGVELFNPRDERSRSTHSAIEGLIVKKNSQAFAAIRPGPPWSYQCRCDVVPIMMGDPADSDLEEPADAFARVTSIERFNATR